MTRRNIIANYVGQGATAVLGLAFVPWYIKYLTVEAYGIVGLFSVVQVWLLLLDFGMTPTLDREMARFKAGALDIQSVRNLLRSFELACAAIALVAAGVLALSARYLAANWIQVGHLDVVAVGHALMIMGVVVSLRFCEGIYRSALIGLQQQVWYNAAGVGLAVLRSGGAVVVLAVSPTLTAFFLWQGVISVVTLALFRFRLYATLPAAPRPARFDGQVLRRVRGFAGGMIVVTIANVVFTQGDKLLLLHLVPLKQFSYYMVAATVAGVLFLAVAPITQAIYPVFVRLTETGQLGTLARNYHAASEMVAAVLAVPVALLVMFPRTLLFIWSNNADVATNASPFLRLLAVGQLCYGLVQVPIQLQLSHGWIRLLLRLNIGVVFVQIVALVFIVPRFGLVAAASIWLVLNVAMLVLLLPRVHARLLTGELRHWVDRDVARPLGAALAVVAIAAWLRPDAIGERFDALAYLVAVGVAALLAVVAATTSLRARLVGIVRDVVHHRRVRL